MKPTIDQLLDTKGRPLTQSLFLEIGYNTDTAIYSLKERDAHYQGKVYPSLKRLYLTMEDPTEYDFATTYFSSWQHWQRICKNKLFAKHVEEWREELELRLRSAAIRGILDQSANEKGFQAAKWIADKGWEKRGRGRPPKDTEERDARIEDRLSDEFEADIIRMRDYG